jgi:hypothetical protein
MQEERKENRDWPASFSLKWNFHYPCLFQSRKETPMARSVVPAGVTAGAVNLSGSTAARNLGYQVVRDLRDLRPIS